MKPRMRPCVAVAITGFALIGTQIAMASAASAAESTGAHRTMVSPVQAQHPASDSAEQRDICIPTSAPAA
ncbi:MULTISPECIES: hypothetical protein [Streptomyces]|uniref:hypothetical protein n=1 Tax=Streptomyces TaxID=1883 RepID=UPI00141573E6|nr:hypothetical protein [Streptomyces sp. SID7805]MYU50590.1 hypothetical protein [Streptomyces sp. SID7805]